MVGVVITVVGSLLAGVGTLFSFSTALGLLLMIVLTAVALNTMMFLLVVRVDDPLVPRAIFGILNTLLFFPSGAVYPIQAFPWWLRGIAKVDPFTFAVHGFKTLLLKEAGLSAIVPDIIYLSLVRGGRPEHRHAALQAHAVEVCRLSEDSLRLAKSHPQSKDPISGSPSSVRGSSWHGCRSKNPLPGQLP